jgi:predicted transcriptional regulator
LAQLLRQILSTHSRKNISDNRSNPIDHSPVSSLVCLEDGKKFKSLRRHLHTHYDLTPEQYRERWGLPHDYPMVAPNYAEARLAVAKKMGLGQQRRRK